MQIEKVALTNILEDELEILKSEDGLVELEFGPFEIKTIKITILETPNGRKLQ